MKLRNLRELSSLVVKPIKTAHQGELINIHSLFFKPRYFSELIRGLTRFHRPVFSSSVKSAMAQVTYSDLDLRDWQSFVQHFDGHIHAPLTYYNSAGAFCLFKILAELRINFSKILHLKAEFELTEPLKTVNPDSVYTVRMELVDVLPRRMHCLLVIQSQLLDETGRVVREHRDFWLVKNCPEARLQGVIPSGQHTAEEFRGISNRPAEWQNWAVSTLKKHEHHLHPTAGRHYGRISGDHNLFHTTHWGARLCGQKRPFLQGFGLMNLVLQQASQVKQEAASALAITFARPAYVGQTLSFYFAQETFEICDEQSQLVAFGSYH